MNVSPTPVRTEEPARISQDPLLVNVLMASWESSVKQVEISQGKAQPKSPKATAGISSLMPLD